MSFSRYAHAYFFQREKVLEIVSNFLFCLSFIFCLFILTTKKVLVSDRASSAAVINFGLVTQHETNFPSPSTVRIERVLKAGTRHTLQECTFPLGTWQGVDHR